MTRLNDTITYPGSEGALLLCEVADNDSDNEKYLFDNKSTNSNIRYQNLTFTSY